MRYTPFRHLPAILTKKVPIQLTLFLTKRCNARCSFCFYVDHQEQRPNRDTELRLDEIDKISASLGKLLWLAFSGGEVFLRDDLVEIASIFYERNKPAIILIPTNGMLPESIKKKTEAIVKLCRKSTVTVKISLDGPPELHDKLRGVRGAYHKAMETYSLLKTLTEHYDNLELGFNTVFCAANYQQMPEITAMLQDIDREKTHTVSLIRGKKANEDLNGVETKHYLETIRLLEENLKKKITGRYRFCGARLKAAQDILQRRLIYQTLTDKQQVIPCYAGRLSLVVTEIGDVFPCESFAQKIGNVRNQGFNFSEMFSSEQCKQALQRIARGECYCTHECYMMMNILFNPRMYPSLISEYMQLL